MNKRTGIIMAVVTGVAVIVAILAVALSGGSDNNSVSTGDQSTTTQATLPVAANGGGSSGGGNSSGGSGGGSSPTQPQSTNKPPYIRDLTGDTDTTDDQGNHVPVGLIDGHAIDPDGPNDQEVETITVNWGDGNTTTAGKGGNNAFSAQHPYDISFSGQTVTVKVTVIDSSGATASQNVTLNLPTI